MEDTSLQICWASLPPGGATVEVGDRSWQVGSPRPDWHRPRPLERARSLDCGPGALSVEGLRPGHPYRVRLIPRHGDPLDLGEVHTLSPPPGELLARFATVSDCHLGEERLGLLRTLRDPRPLPEGLEPYALRTARAALREAVAWGAGLLVAKGDLTAEARREEARLAGLLLAEHLPAVAVLGNHDVRGEADLIDALGEVGVRVFRRPGCVDLPGLRLVLAHSPVPGRHGGRLAEGDIRQILELAGETDSAVALVMHHPLRPHRLQVHWPPALDYRDSARLAVELPAANPHCVVLAGHSHRNRFYRLGDLPVAEVGSTKDYPGCWAGYALHAGGIRQVVRRVADPAAMAWTESTRVAAGGLWSRWSPGRLADRCWTLSWASYPR